ncbi:glycosyltransferase [Akkermansiaceae bacterium]|nr:glycosyltransferase [Akkermansiaceae bacterium]MDB4684333.1 glycosyltransferase [Akkermansiaceae bacterium]
MFDLVSIVMPAYNSSEFVVESILSIQAQTHTNWELLITDDCSSDKTVKIIRNLAATDSRIKVFQLAKNRGAGVARNHSIEKAAGRYIAFCDSDDQWVPNKLENQLRFMRQHDLGFTYTSYEKIDEAGNSIGSVTCLPRVTYKTMLRNNYIGCLTVVYDTRKLGKQFMPTIRKRQDWALWLKILKQSPEARGIQEFLSIYRDRAGSISSNKLEMVKYNWIIFNDVEKLGILRSSWCMIEFMWHYFSKKTGGK